LKKFILPILALGISQQVVARGSVDFLQFQRLNTPNNPGVANSWYGFNYHDSWNIDKYRARTHADISARHYTQGKATIFSVQEAYIEKKRGNTTYISGRQVIDWFPEEKFWQLGKLNGLRSFSFTEEDQEGLVGLQFKRKMWGGEVSVFGSLLYIPELNPGYTFRDGEIVGNNEWSRMPPTEIRFREGRAPVKYELIPPDIQTIMAQKSFGLNFKKDLKWLSLSLFGIVKPESKLRSGAYGYYEQINDDAAKMRIRGFTLTHSVYGAQLTFPMGDFKLNLGGIFVEPDPSSSEKFEPESYENYQYEPDVYKERYYTASIVGAWGSGGISLNYVSGKEELVQKFDADSNAEPLFGSEMKWKNAVGMSVYYQLYDRFILNAKVQADIEKLDRLFKAELKYQYSNFAEVLVGAEIIDAPEDTSFWSTFRSNDSSYVKLSYVF